MTRSASMTKPYSWRTSARTMSTSYRDGAYLDAGSSRYGRRRIPPVGLPARNECRTCARMSSIALRRLVFPEAFAPKTPATGRTRAGCPPSRQVTCRTASFSASDVASIVSSTSSRKDRTFPARNARRTDPPHVRLSRVTRQLSQKTCGKATEESLLVACSSRPRAAPPGGWQPARDPAGGLTRPGRGAARRPQARPAAGRPRPTAIGLPLAGRVSRRLPSTPARHTDGYLARRRYDNGIGSSSAMPDRRLDHRVHPPRDCHQALTFLTWLRRSAAGAPWSVVLAGVL